MPDVEHQPDAHRFIVATETGEAELTYTLATGLIVFTHTGVPEAAEGQGIGKRLAEAGLAYARAEGLRVLPLCPFVKSYMHRHPETQDLLTSGFKV